MEPKNPIPAFFFPTPMRRGKGWTRTQPQPQRGGRSEPDRKRQNQCDWEDPAKIVIAAKEGRGERNAKKEAERAARELKVE